MSTAVKSVMVNVPVSVAYNQWTQFEDFPRFMGGVKSVTQLSDGRLEWVAEIAGVKRQWLARIVEQVPDQKVAWAAVEGATNAGEVTFEDVGGGQTSVRLVLDYEPEGLVEKVGDKLSVVERQVEGDLDRFKAFIESEGYATGAWRGTVAAPVGSGTPSVDDADASRGDSGKAGLSAAQVVAGVGAAAAAGVAAVAVAATRGSDEEAGVETEPVSVDRPDTVPTVVQTDGVADSTTFDRVGTSGEERTIAFVPPVTDGADAERAGGFPADGRD